MDVIALVDQGIKLEKKISNDRKALDEVKAQLTNIAFTDMENKGLKFKQIQGNLGIFNAAYKEKFEVDNFEALKKALGDLVEDKISRKIDVKYDVENKFKKALTALFKGDFSNEPTIDQVLVGLGITDIKAAKKKLKGDYVKDKKVLESFGASGHLEEELDAIRLYKNYELISRYFEELTDEKIEAIKKGVFVEESLSVGFEYEKQL